MPSKARPVVSTERGVMSLASKATPCWPSPAAEPLSVCFSAMVVVHLLGGGSRERQQWYPANLPQVNAQPHPPHPDQGGQVEQVGREPRLLARLVLERRHDQPEQVHRTHDQYQ